MALVSRNKDINISEILRRVPIFRNCGDAFFTKFGSASHVEEHDKGKTLFLSGDAATRFYLIGEGWVKLYRETAEGAQAIIDILTNGQMFGETALFHEDLCPFSAETVEPTKLISLPLSLLKQEINTNNTLAVAMLTSMARYRRYQDQEIEHRSLQNASQRIGCFLLRLTDQYDLKPCSITLPYDKTLLASRLGMQPETFSRALSKLKDATGIRVKGSTIEIDDIDRLSEFSCSACSSDFPCKDITAGTVC